MLLPRLARAQSSLRRRAYRALSSQRSCNFYPTRLAPRCCLAREVWYFAARTAHRPHGSVSAVELLCPWSLEFWGSNASPAAPPETAASAAPECTNSATIPNTTTTTPAVTSTVVTNHRQYHHPMSWAPGTVLVRREADSVMSQQKNAKLREVCATLKQLA